MNKQIRELAEQQGFIGPNYLISSQELEKFAELIVSDILKVVAAHALSGDSAVDVYANLIRLYEQDDGIEE